MEVFFTMKLSTRSRYGTRMVLDIVMHGENGPVPIQEISKRRKLSVKYLEKLIRPLKQSGLVRSKRGPKGGHMLTREPGEITVGEVVRILEGNFGLCDCVKDPAVCPISEDCVTRALWTDAAEGMYERLDAITFAELAARARPMESKGLPCC